MDDDELGEPPEPDEELELAPAPADDEVELAPAPAPESEVEAVVSPPSKAEQVGAHWSRPTAARFARHSLSVPWPASTLASHWSRQKLSSPPFSPMQLHSSLQGPLPQAAVERTSQNARAKTIDRRRRGLAMAAHHFGHR
jgi:hypothetical protein